LPVKQGAEKGRLAFHRLLGKVQKRVSEEKHKKQEDVTETPVESPDELRFMIQDGMNAFEEERYEEAEKCFISAIRIDMKNKDAYRGLGDVYFAEGQYKEAEETYRFLLHLDPNEDITYVRLADIAEEKKDLTAAVEYMQQAILLNDGLSPRFVRLADLLVELQQYHAALEAISQAVELEAENPRYLDKLIEISVLCGQKDIAEDAYQRLRMANPENKKLEVFKDKIRQIV
jgi:tetratricopeptide (TPR) repeat protein